MKKPDWVIGADVNDQYTTWHDHENNEGGETDCKNTLYEMSTFDACAAAWHEAWKRATWHAVNNRRVDYEH